MRGKPTLYRSKSFVTRHATVEQQSGASSETPL
jgi:hypothetical protein